MPTVGFEPTISAAERPQTYALDRAATGTGKLRTKVYLNTETTFRACKLITIFVLWRCDPTRVMWPPNS